MNKIDASVSILTYNNEKEISQALDSILSQKTKYTYEIVVSDDCSQDNTASILKEYKNKYPDIIRLNLNEHNLGITENFYKCKSSCKGRYIISLDGDDYWINDNLLEEEISFLDSHNEYYAVAVCVEGRFDNETKPYGIYPAKNRRNITVDKKEFLKGNGVMHHGMMIRNEYLTKEGMEYYSTIKKATKHLADGAEMILVVNRGPIYSMDIVGVAHRVFTNTKKTSSYCSTNSFFDKLKYSISMYNYFYNNFTPHDDLFQLYKGSISSGIAGIIRYNALNEFREVYKIVPEEYKKRHLLLRSIPRMIYISFATVIRKVRGFIVNKRNANK